MKQYLTHVSINGGRSWQIPSDYYLDKINELKPIATEGVHELFDPRNSRSLRPWFVKCGAIRASSGSVNFSILKSKTTVYRGWVVWGQNASEKMWRKTLNEYEQIKKISRDAPILPWQLPWLVTIEDDSAGHGSLWANEFACALAFAILQNADVGKIGLK